MLPLKLVSGALKMVLGVFQLALSMLGLLLNPVVLVAVGAMVLYQLYGR